MAQDHRILDSNGVRLPYTSENRGFKTNISKGCRHGSVSSTAGSVFDSPLVSTGGYSLWLEHVVNKANYNEAHWLMWYDSQGIPTIPLSGVFGKNELRQMISQLADFVP